ncbi:MAG: hypothetical protein ABEJ87_04665 [Candidatus Nanohalobium sp.]
MERWISEELEGFDDAVLMGVPGSEIEKYTDATSEILRDPALEKADIYSHEQEGNFLGLEYEEIEYEKSPSRIADVEWMREKFSSDEDIAVVSFDYNLRTGLEIDRRMEDHRTFGQFTPEFEDFQAFTLGNYVKSLLPFTESFSDELEDYGEKLRSEVFRHSLSRLPYGQELKNLGKKGFDRVLGGFEY